MTTRRAACALLSIALWSMSIAAFVSPASAQQPRPVTLRLLGQTPFTTPEQPRLDITFQARNTGNMAIGDLSVGLTIGQPIRSRDDYQTSLVDGPLASGGVPRYSLPVMKKHRLEPGQTRHFTISLDLTPYVLSDDSLVYPAQVDLRSGGEQVATLNTPIVHLIQKPEVPMRFTWWAEVTAPVAMNPAGQLSDPAFEASIAPGGSLQAEVAALERIEVDPQRGDTLVLIVEPAVLDQLSRMADGYQRTDGSTVAKGEGGAANAAALLASLRSVSAGANVQVAATPFSAPLIPSLLNGGLAPDLDRQRTLGDAVVHSLLGVPPADTIMRPPAGALDDASVAALAGGGVTTILGDAGTAERAPQPNGFAPPPTADLTATDGSSVGVVLPDPDTSALLHDPSMLSDPVRAAQAVLGELATIWREQPGPPAQPDGSPTIRGVAVGLSAGLPARLWGPLTRRLADATFLHPVTAGALVKHVSPSAGSVTLADPVTAAFPDSYVEAIRDGRHNIEGYGSMLVQDSAIPQRLYRALLYAEAGEYLAALDQGQAWIDYVDTTTGEAFDAVSPQTGQVFTLTSDQGTIPLRMGDPGLTPLRVRLQLRSSSFTFPDGGTQVVTLDRPNQIVTFRVEATAGGPVHPIKLLVRAPNGQQVVADRTLRVRSAAINRIALYITIAAAFVLMGLWSRRLFKRQS